MGGGGEGQQHTFPFSRLRRDTRRRRRRLSGGSECYLFFPCKGLYFGLAFVHSKESSAFAPPHHHPLAIKNRHEQNRFIYLSPICAYTFKNTHAPMGRGRTDRQADRNLISRPPDVLSHGVFTDHGRIP